MDHIDLDHMWEIAIRDDAFDIFVPSDIRLLIRECQRLREPRPQSGWRSIESAPTDGTIVIIPGGCGYCTDGIWKSWQNHRPIQWDLKWWMPLPAPPAE